MNRIILNQQQEAFVNRAVDWYNNSSSNLLQLTGGAGTGKSVVLNAVIERLGLEEDEILPMAYTGQACSVMRMKGLPKACTCHSGLFYPIKENIYDKYGNIKYDKQFNIPLTRWKMVPKDFNNTNIKLIVLDEAWMIPYSFRKHIDRTGIKVLAAGDPFQLPPVKDNPGYLIDGEIHHLTELMRQAETSPIVYLANRAKAGLPIECGLYNGEVLVLFEDELNDEILSRSNIILCGMNETRIGLNHHIREQILGFNTDYPKFGERVICKKNNWDLEINGLPLVNGLVGTVRNQPDVSTFNGQTFDIEFLPDLISEPFYTKANLQYLNAGMTERELLKKSPYTFGDLFDYAYASTVHSSQGSEYYFGTYIEEFIRGGERYRNALNYTAITRFKKNMVYVKPNLNIWKMR